MTTVDDLPAVTIGDTGWHALAACRGEPTDLFFPTKDTSATRRAEAKAICDRCPVKIDCYKWATTNGIADGLWGGVTESRRRGERRADGNPRLCARCGSVFRGVKASARYCSDPCRQAARAASIRRYNGKQ